MDIQSNQNVTTRTLKQATLCFLVKENKILLAMKKRGFAVGKLNGVGGKKNPDESIEDTARRETNEEIGVVVEELEQVATLHCSFPNNPDWGQQVTVFLVKEWHNEPEESEEMAPKWFNIEDIPFDQMWPDERMWLPLVLDGKKIEAEFVFGEGDVIISHKIRVL